MRLCNVYVRQFFQTTLFRTIYKDSYADIVPMRQTLQVKRKKVAIGTFIRFLFHFGLTLGESEPNSI